MKRTLPFFLQADAISASMRDDDENECINHGTGLGILEDAFSLDTYDAKTSKC